MKRGDKERLPIAAAPAYVGGPLPFPQGDGPEILPEGSMIHTPPGPVQ